MSGSRKTKRKPYWKKMKPPYQVGIDDFTIRDVEKDEQGWADVKMFLPHAYDLVLMQLESKTIPGWWNGIHWEGLRLKSEDKVICWKMKEKEEGEISKWKRE